MPHFFADHRQQLQTFLHDYLRQKRAAFEPEQYWAADVFTRLDSYVVSGKLLRGLLVILAAHSFTAKDEPDTLVAAAAMEIFHSALLVHDDIIDQDLLRRTQPSMHAQYQQLAQTMSFRSPTHTGESLAICVGDICLFLSHDLLSQLESPASPLSQLQSLYTSEAIRVGLAEMQDVRMAVTPEVISREEILNMYVSKTGRYSIYLPLAMGSLVAQPQPTFLPVLEKLGESLGILMQIKDDELGLFGTEAETGKPIISDVREGKQTLFYLYAKQLANPAEAQILNSLYGKADLTLSELEAVKKIVIDSGAFSQVMKEIEQLQHEAESQVAQLPIKSSMLPMWQELLTQHSTRKH